MKENNGSEMMEQTMMMIVMTVVIMMKNGDDKDAGLLEPPERPQGSPATSSVWREDPGLPRARTL